MIFLQLPENEKIEIINQMHEETNLPQVIIEKDLWVTAVLRALFALPYAANLSFKGGTSLSKCWNLIERFSEDVDIAINREFFGFLGDTFTTKQISKNLRKATCKFIRDTLQFDLAKQLIANGIPENLFSVSMNITEVTTIDPEKVFIEYKSVFNASPYIKNTVVLEIGGRSMKEPLQKVEIQSFIDKHFSQATFVEKSFAINVIVPERTFLEKVCLLHEEFSKPNEQMRIDRMSRHIYDLARMIDTPIADNALKNKDLFQSIVAHRRMFIAMKDFDYDTLSPKTIKIIPPDSVIAKWEDDYNKMQTMIYGKSMLFSDIIDKITNLNEEIKRLGW
ncbi:MAG TPA: nucleotidyl transferase AbiEii/AbiGii toxin family protein [Paludibacteraceae bacterium]|nr:nucleotidyl transferase AbiEii/AbiGii toxin family protein [Paludibacteraceae bacterium]